MIDRYARELTQNIWSDDNKYKIWLEIEILACEAQEKLGNIPAGVASSIRQKADFDVSKIFAIEQKVKHDVIAFLTNVAEYVGEESRFIHLGMTSSDVLDTCLSVQLKQIGSIILSGLDKTLAITKRRAYEAKDYICIGRSHGIHAEPTTFGLKFARFYAEMKRNKQRLQEVIRQVAVCAISGAVGTFANIDPYVQQYVAEHLGLSAEEISTQIIPRDRHAFFFSTLSVIASSIENIATEIRHCQRTEVLEVEEYFSEHQKGSSAMPHKRNPVLSENLTGLSRLVRSYAVAATENTVTWHERDISHSSVERVVAPDATILLDFAICRLNNLLDNLLLYPTRMKTNLDRLKGLVYSQRVMLALVQHGMRREHAYKIVQRNAMKIWNNLDGNNSFLEELLNDNDINIPAPELEELFSIDYHTKNIDHIFDSVFE